MMNFFNLWYFYYFCETKTEFSQCFKFNFIFFQVVPICACIKTYKWRKKQPHSKNLVNHTILPMRPTYMQFKKHLILFGKMFGKLDKQTIFWFLIILHQKLPLTETVITQPPNQVYRSPLKPYERWDTYLLVKRYFFKWRLV